MMPLESLASRVKVLPVTVILHWPDRWCSYCLQECEDLSNKLYYCPSCAKYTAGRTQTVEAEARRVR